MKTYTEDEALAERREWGCSIHALKNKGVRDKGAAKRIVLSESTADGFIIKLNEGGFLPCVWA